MMLEEALQFIQRNAVEAHGKQFFRPEGEAANVFWVRSPDGTMSRHELTTHHRETANDVATIAAIAKACEEGANSPECWYSRGGVIVTFDGRPVGSRATLTLTPSPQMKRLAEWDQAGGGKCKQVSWILLLRTLFSDCLPTHPDLRDDCSKVSFKKAQDAESTVKRGNVSVSKALMVEASGLDRLPETLTFEVPAFAQAAVSCKVSVRAAFDPEPAEEEFRLVVFPGDIERAWAAAEDRLQALLEDAMDNAEAGEVPLYRGTP